MALFSTTLPLARSALATLAFSLVLERAKFVPGFVLAVLSTWKASQVSAQKNIP